MTDLEDLQRALFATLSTDAAIAPLIGGVFDDVPEKPFGSTTAYISFGSLDGGEDDADCIDGDRYTVQIDVWSKAVGALECRSLTSMVKAALHRRQIALAEHALAGIWVELVRVFPDPSGIHHGVVHATCMIERAA